MHEIGPGQLGLLLERPAAFQLGPERSRTGADDGKGRIQQKPDAHEFPGRALVEDREQRRPLGHDRKAAEQGDRGRLFAPRAGRDVLNLR